MSVKPVYIIPEISIVMILPLSAVPVNNNIFPIEISPVMIDPLIGEVMVGADGGVVSSTIITDILFELQLFT